MEFIALNTYYLLAMTFVRIYVYIYWNDDFFYITYLLYVYLL